MPDDLYATGADHFARARLMQEQGERRVRKEQLETFRDEIAKQALEHFLPSIASHSIGGSMTDDQLLAALDSVSERCYQIASAMIAARERVDNSAT